MKEREENERSEDRERDGGNEKRTFPERTNDIDKFPVRVMGRKGGREDCCRRTRKVMSSKCYTHGKQKRILGNFDANELYNQTEEDKSLKRCHQEEKTKREQTRFI